MATLSIFDGEVWPLTIGTTNFRHKKNLRLLTGGLMER